MDVKKNDDYSIKMPEVPLNDMSGKKSPLSPFPSRRASSQVVPPLSQITNSPPISILAYCLSSISMTVINKYCVSGKDWNLNFFYLCIQSVVCIVAIQGCKSAGLITNLAPFDTEKAKRCTFTRICDCPQCLQQTANSYI